MGVLCKGLEEPSGGSNAFEVCRYMNPDAEVVPFVLGSGVPLKDQGRKTLGSMLLQIM